MRAFVSARTVGEQKRDDLNSTVSGRVRPRWGFFCYTVYYCRRVCVCVYVGKEGGACAVRIARLEGWHGQAGHGEM